MRAGTAATRRGLASWWVGLELVTAVVVGSGLGWFLDDGLGTQPWFVCLFLLLGGGAAGMMNAYYVVGRFKQSVDFEQEHDNHGKQRYAEIPGSSDESSNPRQ